MKVLVSQNVIAVHERVVGDVREIFNKGLVFPGWVLDEVELGVFGSLGREFNSQVFKGG